AVAAPDEARAHTLLGQVGQLLLDRLAEQLHQRIDLVLRARPVLGREGVHRERPHAELDAALDGAAQRARAGAVTRRDWQAAALRPAAVVVDDDRNGDRD